MMLFAFSCLWVGCDENTKFDDTIFEIKEPKLKEIDKWILSNYVDPYNIEVIYRWEDIESDASKNLIPPQLDTIVPFLKVVKRGWIDTYVELCGNEVINPVFPKQILLLGCAGYNQDGTKTLGTAEGGKKVVLYEVDAFDPKDAANIKGYIRVLHHEFTHILTQNKEYSLAYKQITPKSYTSAWKNNSETTARSLGFVTPYAMSEPDEDVAEMIAEYITNTPEGWDSLINGISNAEGKANVLKKLDIVRTYMEESWKIDINQLRDLVNQAMKDVVNGNY